MVDMPALQADQADYTIEEQALVAKTGDPQTNEDLIHTSHHFVAVIDGTTSKTTRRWDGKTGGQICAQIIDQTLSQLPRDITAREAIDAISARIQQFYEKQGVLELVQADPTQRATAALIVASLGRREIWFVGDCQCLLDGHLIQNEKSVDEITAQARAMFLESELQKGATIEELRQRDTGREFILPLLKQQQLFQNNPAAGPYWYSIIDGFLVPDEGIRIEFIPAKTHTIVLASDGYPILKESLETSEQELQCILESDPLLFRAYKSTKGVHEGAVSYDDRAYIKVRLQDHEQTGKAGEGRTRRGKSVKSRHKLRKKAGKKRQAAKKQ